MLKDLTKKIFSAFAVLILLMSIGVNTAFAADSDGDGIPDDVEGRHDQPNVANSNSGSGKYIDQFYIFNWSNSSFADGINVGDKQIFDLANGVSVEAKVISSTGDKSYYKPTDMNTWSGASLYKLYNTPGDKEAIYSTDEGKKIDFKIRFTANKNGNPYRLDLLALDAESTDSSGESIEYKTNGGPWELIEKTGNGGIVNGSGTTDLTIKDNSHDNQSIFYSPDSNELEVKISTGSDDWEGVAFGIWLTYDTDGDGIIDSEDLDSDNDGIPDSQEAGNDPTHPVDTDGDGIPDFLDIDSDNDGITDIVEQRGDNSRDTDGDGTPDYLDLDADGDGIKDIVEAGGTDSDNDGILDDTTDTDGDGLTDISDKNQNTADYPSTDQEGLDASTLTDEAADQDGDNKRNFQDVDSDGDGIPDEVEKGNNANGVPVDTDGDGTPDYLDLDSDNDGIPDSSESGVDPTHLVDTDGDGTPDYLDLDSDQDGIPDVTEAGGTDTDGDGIIDGFTDANNDGLDDATAVNPLANLDTDGDGHKDYLDKDSDNDGISDTIESGSDPKKPVDSDGDGIEDYLDLDADDDGIPDAIEAQPTTGYVGNDGDVSNDVNNKGEPSYEVSALADTDGDGTPDYLDLDSDNDNKKDKNESGLTLSGNDTDNDGIDDAVNASYLDPDGDINNPTSDLENEFGGTHEVAYREKPQGSSGPRSSKPKSKKIVYTCKDSRAINFSSTGTHKQSLCIYKDNIKSSGDIKKDNKKTEQINIKKTCVIVRKSCPVFTQHMKLGDRDGQIVKHKQEAGVSSLINEIALLQAHLKKQGFYNGPIDGYYSKEVFNAVSNWQEKYRSEVLDPWNLKRPTGYFYKSSERAMNILLGCKDEVILDTGKYLSKNSSLKVLDYAKEGVKICSDKKEEEKSEKLKEKEEKSGEIVVSKKTCPIFTQHMRKGDRDGKVGQEKQEAGVSSVINEVRKLQTYLKQLGFNPGKIDGVFGAQTEKAVRDWQWKNKANVLTPWDLNHTTGRFYKSSERWMNEILGCHDEVVLDNGKILK